MRQLSEHASDVDAERKAFTKSWEPSSPRHVDAELWRDLAASLKSMEKSNIMSTARPEDNKIVTSLAISMAAFMEPVWKKCCIVLPQELFPVCLIINWTQRMFRMKSASASLHT